MAIRTKGKLMCPHDPRETTGPIGMYHCPECGEMVVANMEHPDYSLLDDLDSNQQLIQLLNPGDNND